MKRFWKGGDPFIWLTATALAITMMMVFGLVALIASRGLGHFWPKPVAAVHLRDGRMLLGEVTQRERIRGEEQPREPAYRIQLKVGNRDAFGSDFVWVREDEIEALEHPPDAVSVERMEWGNLYGFLRRLETPEGEYTGAEAWSELERLLPEIRQARRRFGARGDHFPNATAFFELSDGRLRPLPAFQLVNAVMSNQMKPSQRLGHYIRAFWGFVSGYPRESNTEGGVFPAIFGTVLMVLIMTVAVVPFGVSAALFLREYAGQSALVSAVRIAVNNLAGVPSIVYGVFGLGFFVYFIGGGIDRLFFADSLPTPTFGTGGILWASLTLALLTAPVVIVAAEEGLAAVPRSLREGSLALGATRWETIRRVVLPRAAPAILTGVILAMARGAGEVAPLMMTGVVKLAPALAVDGTFPFVHLERKFMHLGFHIYDVGFQSPNVEAARPMVYASAFILLAVVVALNLIAIRIRGLLRAKLRQEGGL